MYTDDHFEHINFDLIMRSLTMPILFPSSMFDSLEGSREEYF